MNAVLKPFTPVSWFHPTGVYLARKRLEPMLPDVSGSLFLTFTLDPSLFDNLHEAFERGRDRLRRVFFKLRRGVEWNGGKKQIDAPYCVKVEFHASGAVHFHAVFLTRRYVPNDLLERLWGLGFTKVRRISEGRFRYLLKYVTKGGGLPDWVLGRSRLRIFQSSKGFLVKTEEKKPEAQQKPNIRRRRQCTTGERLERWKRTAVLEQGELRRRLILRAPWKEIFDAVVCPIALAGRYLGFGKFQINDIEDLRIWISPLLNQTSAESP